MEYRSAAGELTIRSKAALDSRSRRFRNWLACSGSGTEASRSLILVAILSGSGWAATVS